MALSKRAAQWEWEGDRGVWQQYPTHVQEELTQAFDAGKSEVTTRRLPTAKEYRCFVSFQVDVQQTEQTSMTIRFSDMIQTNQGIELTRRVRLCLEMDGKNGFFVYEYQDEKKKKWFVYNAAIMLAIAKATDDDLAVASVSAEQESLEIDLDELVETNLTTDRTRNIRAVKSSLFCHLLCSSLSHRNTDRLVAKLPLNVSDRSNKRLFDNNESLDYEPKKRVVSKSKPIEKSAGTNHPSMVLFTSRVYLQFAQWRQLLAKFLWMLNAPVWWARHMSIVRTTMSSIACSIKSVPIFLDEGDHAFSHRPMSETITISSTWSSCWKRIKRRSTMFGCVGERKLCRH